MMKDKKKLAGILIALNLAFIWGNSMRVGSDSQALSMGILEFFNLFLNLEVRNVSDKFIYDPVCHDVKRRIRAGTVQND